jgi:hypothetical protein
MYKQHKQVFSLGNRAEVKDEVTCQSMKRSGNTKNGLYPLRNAEDKYPRLALCNMESTDGYEDVAMESSIGYLDLRSLPGGVVFSAMLNNDPPLNLRPGTLIFTKIVSNIGNSFDLITGIFKVPVSGTYQFTFSSLTGSDSNSLSYVQVMKNGNIEMSIMEGYRYSKGYLNSFGQTWQMNLISGDNLSLYLADTGGIIYLVNQGFTTFTGELILE